MAGDQKVVPNIFQLSTGETSLLNLFLSILRDFELSGASFRTTENIRGIVVVDEVDLHLHVSHQYSILPKLMKLFPKVQFIVTTHSPLFILGMRNEFGDGGFALYRMPGGNEIDPEEFSEFESAYESFTLTSRHTDGLRSAIEGATKPIVVVEGTIDQDYIVKASKLLNYQLTLAKVELNSGNGAPNLNKIWNTPTISRVLPVTVNLFYDFDQVIESDKKGSFSRQSIPFVDSNPIKRGIENLFSQDTLSRAVAYKPAFIDIKEAHSETVRGTSNYVPETWTINEDEKRNLCNWLCESGTAEDFKAFEVVFDMIEALFDVSGDSDG